MSSSSMPLWSALGTTTTNPIVHQGSALPAARVVIVVVPTIALATLWWLSRHRGQGRDHR